MRRFHGGHLHVRLLEYVGEGLDGEFEIGRPRAARQLRDEAVQFLARVLRREAVPADAVD